MLAELLHKLAGHPWVYDRIQTLAGNKKVLAFLSQGLAPLNPRVVVDIGGGTGTVQNLLAAECRYICLDVEMPKLEGFRKKVAGGLAILGDATSMPLRDGFADMVICKSVTHHLTDSQLDRALDESRRILRPGGYMVLFDAVLNKKRWAGLALWKLDRGSYPRPIEALQGKFAGRFEIARWEKMAVYHEYIFAIGVRR
jgi:ubiquinone/menaquinone biosynthesis C-methylase UbiE